MKELEREKADVAELEACDQAYPNELKGSTAEQWCAHCLISWTNRYGQR